MIGRIGLALLVGVVACNKERAKEPSPAPEPTPEDPLFIVARPRITTMALPARFTGPLPASLAELERGGYPLKPFIRAALAANTYEIRKRMVAALTRAAAAGAMPEQLSAWYEDVAGFAPSEATCRWLIETAPTLPATAKIVLWRTATHCRFPALASAFSSNEVPDDVIVDWYFGALIGDDIELPYSERVARAAAAYARTADGDFKLRQVGFVFARMKGEASIAAITALQASIADAHRRAVVGIGMLRSSSPAGQRIGERACKHPEVANDAMCARPTERPTERPTDLARMLDDGESVKTLLAKHPRPAVASALTECAKRMKGHQRVRCLRQLAALDRPSALALARGLVSEDPRIAAMARSLEKFPDLPSAEHELARLGFKLDRSKPAEVAFDEPQVTLEDVLFERGRTIQFDAETGMFPNEHDQLLGELAALAAPALDGVVFEEIPPSAIDDEAGRGSYVLHAYAGGTRYTLEAGNHGDWYDVEAVIGLLNALLVANKSDLRVAVLPTGDQTVKVVVGPARGIRALVDAKLIDIGMAGESERAGKEFEDRVFDSIRGDAGGEVLRDVRIK